MQIYFHSRLWSYLPRVPILVEGTVLDLSALIILLRYFSGDQIVTPCVPTRRDAKKSIFSM